MDGYSRRSFLGAMGCSSLVGFGGSLLPRFAAWAASSASALRFAYIASDAYPKQAIHVFMVQNDGAWTHMQSVPTMAPSSLAISADERSLFIANRIRRYQNRPTGSVESYRIDSRTGKLGFICRRPLALSAVGPEHIAVSPDGRFLVVCATAGGAYNLLPILSDGSLGNVTILRKDTGSSVHTEWQSSCHPQQVTFDTHERLISSDLGADRLNVFEIRDDELAVNQRHPCESGSGPSAIEYHPELSVLFAGGALDGTITAHAYDEAHGAFLSRRVVGQATPELVGTRLHAIAVHPSGNFVVAAWSNTNRNGISAWQFKRDSFSLEPRQTIASDGAIESLRFIGRGDQLIAANTTKGIISRFDFAPGAAELKWKVDVATCEMPRAISLIYS